MKCPERAWKYVQENEELQELSDKYFDTPALAEPDLVSIPNPKKHPLCTDATQPFGIWCWTATMSNS